jgi:hypothetical protein
MTSLVIGGGYRRAIVAVGVIVVLVTNPAAL